MPDPKEIFKEILERSAKTVAPGVAASVHVERPKNPEHGDFSTNVALQLSKVLGRKPREIAEELKKASTPELVSRGLTTTAGVSIAGPGFLNIKVDAGFKLRIIKDVLARGRDWGRAQAVQPQKIQVEFVSANPTGPLHVGHGRQGALGDAIASLLEAQGHQVTREFYYNDAGAQIDKLAWSVQARARGLKPGDKGWPEEGYAGEYIEDIAREIANPDDLEAIRRHAVAYLRKEQDADLQAFGVKFNVYSLESSLYSEGKVAAVIEAWKKNGTSFEKDGALWLSTTED